MWDAHCSVPCPPRGPAKRAVPLRFFNLTTGLFLVRCFSVRDFWADGTPGPLRISMVLGSLKSLLNSSRYLSLESETDISLVRFLDESVRPLLPSETCLKAGVFNGARNCLQSLCKEAIFGGFTLVAMATANLPCLVMRSMHTIGSLNDECNLFFWWTWLAKTQDRVWDNSPGLQLWAIWWKCAIIVQSMHSYKFIIPITRGWNRENIWVAWPFKADLLWVSGIVWRNYNLASLPFFDSWLWPLCMSCIFLSVPG